MSTSNPVEPSLTPTDHSTGADLKKELNAYLQDLEESQVRTLQDIIDFNTEHATEELPPRMPLFP